MQKGTFLNSKELKQLEEKLHHQFGFSLSREHAYFRTVKDRIFLVSKRIVELPLASLHIDKVGLYLAEVMHDGSIRLSKEGAQLLAREAYREKKESKKELNKELKTKLKNVVSLAAPEIREYFQGMDLEKDLGLENRFVLLEYQGEIFGCAKYKWEDSSGKVSSSGKKGNSGRILNFLAKIHRGEVIL